MRASSKKQDILLLAANLFAERGFEAVSMRDLGKALQMTPANLYHHFTDKEQLYRETLVDVFSRVAQVLPKPAKEERPQSYLEHLVSGIIAFMLRDTVFTRLMFRELSSDNHERTAFFVEKALRPVYDSIAKALSLLIRENAVTSTLDMLVSSIIGYVNMSRFFSLLHRDASYETDCEAITARIMAGLSLHVASLDMK